MNDKLNYLTNELAVTEEELVNAILDKPEGFDPDLYLSIQAVMQDMMRVDHKVIRNLVKTMASRNGGDVESLLINTKDEFDKSDSKESLITETFGRYMYSAGMILISKLNDVLKHKKAIEGLSL